MISATVLLRLACWGPEPNVHLLFKVNPRTEQKNGKTSNKFFLDFGNNE
jgi:hypothetical protein